MDSPNLDIHSDGTLILCACELREVLKRFGDPDSWKPGEDADRDGDAREVIQAAFNIHEQVVNINEQGLG